MTEGMLALDLRPKRAKRLDQCCLYQFPFRGDLFGFVESRGDGEDGQMFIRQMEMDMLVLDCSRKGMVLD